MYFRYPHSSPKALKKSLLHSTEYRVNCTVTPVSYYPEMPDLCYEKFRHSTMTTVLLSPNIFAQLLHSYSPSSSSDPLVLYPFICLLAPSHQRPLILTSLQNSLTHYAANIFQTKLEQRLNSSDFLLCNYIHISGCCNRKQYHQGV